MRRAAVWSGLGVVLGLAVFGAVPPARAQEGAALPLSCIDFPPYKIAPDAGRAPPGAAPRGMDIEIIQAAFAGSAYQPQFDFMPFKRAIELAARGDYAGICGCSRSPEREATFLFSEPVNTVSLGLFASSEEDLAGIASVADLAGREVIIVNGYVLEKDLRDNGAILSLVPNDRQAAITQAHRPEAILAGFRLPIEYRREREGIDAPIFYRELSSGPNYLCLSRAFPEAPTVMQIFNDGLARIAASGKLDEIRARYRTGEAVPVN